ncbi:MAG: hypothetical protein RR014_02550 [Bilophila sp.]
MPDDQSKHLGLLLPHQQNPLSHDIARIRKSLVLVDTRLHEALSANTLVADGGAGMYARLLTTEKHVARNAVRLARVELEVLKLLQGGFVQPAPGNPDEPEVPVPAPSGDAFTGPVVVSSSLLDLKNAGMLILLQTPEEF